MVASSPHAVRAVARRGGPSRASWSTASFWRVRRRAGARWSTTASGRFAAGSASRSSTFAVGTTAARSTARSRAGRSGVRAANGRRGAVTGITRSVGSTTATRCEPRERVGVPPRAWGITVPKLLPGRASCAPPLRPRRRPARTRAPMEPPMDTLFTLSFRPLPTSTRALVTYDQDEVLRAVLPPAHLAHPRAAATLCEALSLWYQQRLCVVLSADEPDASCALGPLRRARPAAARAALRRRGAAATARSPPGRARLFS